MERESKLNLSEQEKKDIQDFAVKLYEMPTEYFEAKYERPVYLNEFAGAVIPTNLDQDLKDALNKAGLILKEYDNADAREDATKQVLKDMNESRQVLFETIDFTQDFADVANGNITEKDIENHLISLIGQVFDTVTKPLKIQIVNGNKAHILNSNLKLKPNQKKKHNATLNKIEKVINNAYMIGKAEDVDLTHNTNKKH